MERPEQRGHRRATSLTGFFTKLLPSNRPERGGTIRKHGIWSHTANDKSPSVVSAQTDDSKASPDRIITWNAPRDIPRAIRPTDDRHSKRATSLTRRGAPRRDKSVEERRSSWSPLKQQSGQGLEGPFPTTTQQLLPADTKPSATAVIGLTPSGRTTQQLFEDIREARRRHRRSLKESGDFLGVQGVNPYTGELDVLTPTTSSNTEASPVNSPLLRGLAQRVKQAKAAYKEAKKEREAAAKMAHLWKEQNKIDREKESIKALQRRVKWRREEGQWSSVAEPKLSPITQSQRSSPGSSKWNRCEPVETNADRKPASGKPGPSLNPKHQPVRQQGSQEITRPPDAPEMAYRSQGQSILEHHHHDSTDTVIHKAPGQPVYTASHAARELFENGIRFSPLTTTGDGASQDPSKRDKSPWARDLSRKPLPTSPLPELGSHDAKKPSPSKRCSPTKPDMNDRNNSFLWTTPPSLKKYRSFTENSATAISSLLTATRVAGRLGTGAQHELEQPQGTYQKSPDLGEEAVQVDMPVTSREEGADRVSSRIQDLLCSQRSDTAMATLSPSKSILSLISSLIPRRSSLSAKRTTWVSETARGLQARETETSPPNWTVAEATPRADKTLKCQGVITVHTAEEWADTLIQDIEFLAHRIGTKGKRIPESVYIPTTTTTGFDHSLLGRIAEVASLDGTRGDINGGRATPTSTSTSTPTLRDSVSDLSIDETYIEPTTQLVSQKSPLPSTSQSCGAAPPPPASRKPELPGIGTTSVHLLTRTKARCSELSHRAWEGPLPLPPPGTRRSTSPTFTSTCRPGPSFPNGQDFLLSERMSRGAARLATTIRPVATVRLAQVSASRREITKAEPQAEPEAASSPRAGVGVGIDGRSQKGHLHCRRETAPTKLSEVVMIFLQLALVLLWQYWRAIWPVVDVESTLWARFATGRSTWEDLGRCVLAGALLLGVVVAAACLAR